MLANSRDTFFPHTTINGVEVGGLTVAEAQSRLEAEIPQRVCKIYLSGQDGVSTEGPGTGCRHHLCGAGTVSGIRL